MTTADTPLSSCPLPADRSEIITLAHGAGGRAMSRLIETVFAPAFCLPPQSIRLDGGVFSPSSPRLAITTDAFVVQPRIFPGGNLGRLSVVGTINDLAMCGAIPRWFSVALILEEGFPQDELAFHVAEMQAAAAEVGAQIVTGDTKVVPRGQGDGMYAAITGVGEVEHNLTLHPSGISPGDAIIVSGDIGRHGLAVMLAREDWGVEPMPQSDCAPLAAPVQDLIRSGVQVRALRDPTRGGLTCTLGELARAGNCQFEVVEQAVPVRAEVESACEWLGLDPWLLACEGCFVAIVPQTEVDMTLRILKVHSQCSGAAQVGRVKQAEQAPSVVALTGHGTLRIVDMPYGPALPRIC